MSTGDKRSRLKQWLESGEARLQPLTFPQRELWEASPVPPGDPSNHICCLIFVRGRLTEEECQGVLQRVVERQEVLRLSILPGRDGPLQMIRRTMEPNLRFVPLSPDEGTPEVIEERARKVFQEPFDLLQGPLYRVEVLQRGPDDLVFVFAIHHAIADGWTLGALVQDLAGGYVQAKTGSPLEPLPAVPLTYTAWGVAERVHWPQAELDKRAAFWKRILAGAPRLWDGQPGAETPGPLERWVTEFPGELAETARTLARRWEATLFSTLLAAFRLAFADWKGVRDLVVGTPVANRSSAAVRETMGSYAGIVPLRAQVLEDVPFAEVLRRVHQGHLEAFAQAMPFVELARALGAQPTPGQPPVFEVRFALQNHPVSDISLSTLSARLRMRSTGTARFHLGCEITEDGGALEVVWLWRPGLLTLEEVQTLHRLFQKQLTAAASAPESALPGTT